LHWRRYCRMRFFASLMGNSASPAYLWFYIFFLTAENVVSQRGVSAVANRQGRLEKNCPKDNFGSATVAGINSKIS
jgi:hypothetical protein